MAEGKVLNLVARLCRSASTTHEYRKSFKRFYRPLFVKADPICSMAYDLRVLNQFTLQGNASTADEIDASRANERGEQENLDNSKERKGFTSLLLEDVMAFDGSRVLSFPVSIKQNEPLTITLWAWVWKAGK